MLSSYGSRQCGGNRISVDRHLVSTALNENCYTSRLLRMSSIDLIDVNSFIATLGRNSLISLVQMQLQWRHPKETSLESITIRLHVWRNGAANPACMASFVENVSDERGGGIIF